MKNLHTRIDTIVSLYPVDNDSVNAHFIDEKQDGNKTTYLCYETTVDGDDMEEKEHPNFPDALRDLSERIDAIGPSVRWVDVL